uniref:integrase core domain-containing protein n=1 Tax=Portibacter marinus TaxID=2898660 RepID=UPI0021D465FE
RFVVGWSISNTMEAEWCVQVVDEAITMYGKPEIINTDQGSQFSSEIFTKAITKKHKIRLSMDGKGRAIDNVFIERLWRTVKYEKVYLMPPRDGEHLYLMLNDYFHYYNYKRRHSSLNDYHPATIYKTKLKVAA